MKLHLIVIAIGTALAIQAQSDPLATLRYCVSASGSGSTCTVPSGTFDIYTGTTPGLGVNTPIKVSRSNILISGAGINSSLFRRTGSGGGNFQWNSYTSIIVVDNGVSNVTFSNFSIDGGEPYGSTAGRITLPTSPAYCPAGPNGNDPASNQLKDETWRAAWIDLNAGAGLSINLQSLRFSNAPGFGVLAPIAEDPLQQDNSIYRSVSTQISNVTFINNSVSGVRASDNTTIQNSLFQESGTGGLEIRGQNTVVSLSTFVSNHFRFLFCAPGGQLGIAPGGYYSFLHANVFAGPSANIIPAAAQNMKSTGLELYGQATWLLGNSIYQHNTSGLNFDRILFDCPASTAGYNSQHYRVRSCGSGYYLSLGGFSPSYPSQYPAYIFNNAGSGVVLNSYTVSGQVNTIAINNFFASGNTRFGVENIPGTTPTLWYPGTGNSLTGNGLGCLNWTTACP